MKKIVLAALLAAVGSAQATVYNFSMTDGNNKAITGSFEGTAQGNLITDLSNISVALDGKAIGDGRALTAARYVENAYYWAPGAVASFDGNQNNFLFINSEYLAGDYSFNAYTYSLAWLGGSSVYSMPLNYSSWTSGSPANYGWTVTAVNDVPEPASLALFGLAIAGMGAMRRRAK